MRTIHKQTLPSLYGARFSMELPSGSKIIKLAEQSGLLAIWYEFSTDCGSVKSMVDMQTVPTGGAVEDGMDYIDTVLGSEGLVWHLYEGSRHVL